MLHARNLSIGAVLVTTTTDTADNHSSSDVSGPSAVPVPVRSVRTDGAHDLLVINSAQTLRAGERYVVHVPFAAAALLEDSGRGYYRTAGYADATTNRTV